MFNVTLRRVRVTIVTVEKQKLLYTGLHMGFLCPIANAVFVDILHIALRTSRQGCAVGTQKLRLRLLDF
jgi:hypothetical protein